MYCLIHKGAGAQAPDFRMLVLSQQLKRLDQHIAELPTGFTGYLLMEPLLHERQKIKLRLDFATSSKGRTWAKIRKPFRRLWT